MGDLVWFIMNDLICDFNWFIRSDLIGDFDWFIRSDFVGGWFVWVIFIIVFLVI